MTRNLLAIALVAIVLALGACGSDDDTGPSALESGGTTRLWIEPELVDCEGVGPQTCMQIAESEDGEPGLFYDQIEGFTFVEGTSYVVDVTIEDVEDPPADASSVRYVLVDVVEEQAAG